MINCVCLTGRLTKEPELKTAQSGKCFLNFSLAVNREKETTDFINCTAWNKTAELMAQYLHKGSLIGVEGRIQTRNYENQQGQRVYVTEVVVEHITFLEPKSAINEQQINNNAQNNAYSTPKKAYYQKSPNQPYMNFTNAKVDEYQSENFEIDDEDLPF